MERIVPQLHYADFIHLDAAVDSGSAGAYAMATVRVVDGDNVPQRVSSPSFPSSQSSTDDNV